MKEFDRKICSVCVDSLNALIFNIRTYSNKCYTTSEWILFDFLHPFTLYPIPQLKLLALPNRRSKLPVFISLSKYSTCSLLCVQAI